MPRLLTPLVALLVMLCATPLYAQDDAPADHALIGTWMGLTMDGEELEEGDFVLVFNADDTGSINEGDDRPEKFTYTYDADTQRCVIYFDGDEDDAFPLDVSFDGDTATFAPENEEVLVARRVEEQEGDDAGDGDTPQPAGNDADHALVGTWDGIEMGGSELEEGAFRLTFNADGSGSMIDAGRDPAPMSYTYDPDSARLTINFTEDDSADFTVTYEGDTATLTPDAERGPPVVKLQRVAADADQPDGAVPPPPAPVDTSDSPLLGRWMLVQFNGEAVPDGLVAYDHRADGTGQVLEEGEPGDAFGWDHDTDRGVVTVQTPEGETLAFHVILYEDLAVYFSEDHGGMRIVQRRMPVEGAGDDAGALHQEGVVGTWYAQKMEGEWVPADEDFRIEFRADGTAEAFEDGEPEGDPVTYTVDEDRSVIAIFEDGDLEVEMSYIMFDDEMILTIRPPAGVDFEDEMEIHLSRRPEGNEEQQRMRRGPIGSTHPVNGENARSSARRSQSMSNLRQLSLTMVAYWVDNKETAPFSLGIAFSDGYIDAPEVFIAPWQDIEVPEGWEDLSEDAQAEWLDLHSGYGYVGGELAAQAMAGDNPNLGASEAAVLFELPLYEGTEKIAIAFGDGHVETFEYDEADELIEDQTGRTLMGWMEDLDMEQIAIEDGVDADGQAPDDNHDHPHEDHDHD